MHLEIVSHCWNYARLQSIQLSSLVRWPPRGLRVTMTVCYSSTDDPLTAGMLAFFGRQVVPNVTWNWLDLPTPQLMRRAIGRNMRARATEADWVWFADCDHFFSWSFLDDLARYFLPSVADEASLVYPSLLHQSPSHAAGDAFLAAADPLAIHEFSDSDLATFVVKHNPRAIGGLQIARGDACRRLGYCDQPRWQRPETEWKQTKEDPVFRKSLGAGGGVGLDVVGLYRVRHSVCGRREGAVSL